MTVAAITLQGILETVISGLSLGSLYAMFALGLALVFGVMGLVNFAHGELIMIGGYAIVLLAGAPFLVAALAAVICVVVVAMGTERVAFRPLRGANAATLLVTSYAVSYLLQNLAMLIFGSIPKTTSALTFMVGEWSVFGLRIERLDIITLVSAIGLLGVLLFFLRRTDLGLQMRAAAEDFSVARLLGVRANRVIASAFAIAGILAASASILMVAQTGSVVPAIGLSPVLLAFVAVVIGGMGSLAGAVMGAYLLGALTVILQVALPVELAPYRDAFLYTGVFFILVFRPQGLIPQPKGRVI